MTGPTSEPQRGGTNGWAIAAFVLGILGGTILSVIFAIVALFQIRDRRERGRALAIAALVISAVWIAIITSLIAYGISAQGKTVQAVGLRTGDCVKDTSDGELPTWVMRVRCDRPHYGEVVAVLTVPNATTYPGEEALRDHRDECGATFFDYAPNSSEGPAFRVALAYPTVDGWAKGQRSVVCVAMSKHERWSSVRD